MNRSTVTRFRDLANGQTFDFIDDSRPGYNSFFDAVQKLSARTYMGTNGAVYHVGSINAQVFHVGRDFHAAGAAFIPRTSR